MHTGKQQKNSRSFGVDQTRKEQKLPTSFENDLFLVWKNLYNWGQILIHLYKLDQIISCFVQRTILVPVWDGQILSLKWEKWILSRYDEATI